MSMIRRTCVEIHKTFQFIIQQLLTLHSTLLKNFWRKNQSTEFFLFFFFLFCFLDFSLERLTSFEVRTKESKKEKKKIS